MATILLADDDQLLRAIIRDHLARAGHTVLEAGDGLAAMAIALDERPEVLLLDVMMPLARGLEVVRRVRREEAWHPAIAMISARTRVADRLNALEAGADAYIEKPFQPDALGDVVEHLLTDAAHTRFVDVLGPAWAALAVERLKDAALGRRPDTFAGRVRVRELVTSLVAHSLVDAQGVTNAEMDPWRDPLRPLWEETVRAVLHDPLEPLPIVTDVVHPDVVAAVERAITDRILRRRRARRRSEPVLDAFSGDVLAGAIDGRSPRAPTGDPTAPSRRMERPSAVCDDRLRDELAAGWSETLAAILGPRQSEPAGAQRAR